jgi:folate-binding protein YgfZ
MTTIDLGRTVLELTGPDTASYLQGQVSANVETLAVGDSTWSLILEPKGKIVAFFRLVRTEEGFLADIDDGHDDVLVARLERFKLRTDMTILKREDLSVYGVRDGSEPADSVDGIAVGFDWHGWAGFDVIGSVSGELDPESDRIRAGFPRMGTEITPERIPGEVTGVVQRSVDFTKGCYVGQELVARINSRGSNVPRRLVKLASDTSLEPGQVLSADGADAGWVTSSAVDDLGIAMLGYASRSVSDGAHLDASGSEVEVVPIGDAGEPPGS